MKDNTDKAIYELKHISDKFSEGIEILRKLKTCLIDLQENDAYKIKLENDAVDETIGELSFWFVGFKIYIKIRLSPRAEKEDYTGYKCQYAWGLYKNEKDRESPKSIYEYEKKKEDPVPCLYKESERRGFPLDVVLVAKIIFELIEPAILAQLTTV